MTKPAIRSHENRIDLLFVILALFTVTFFMYRDFEIRMLYGFAVLALALGLRLLGQLWQDRPPVLDPMRLSLVCLAAAVLLSFLRPDSRHNTDGILFMLCMILCGGYVIVSRPNEKTGKVVMGVLFGGALAIACFVLFFEYNPWYFWNWFLMKLSYTAGAYLCHYVPKGYGFTLGGATFTDYVLFVGVAVCTGFLVSGRKFDWKSVLALLFGGLFLYTILIIGRRGELLAAALILALLVLLQCSKKQRKVLIIGGIVAMVVGFGLIVALLPWLKQFPALKRYVMTVEQLLKGQDITSGRMELYALAWSGFLKNPLIGLGWDNFHTLVDAKFQAVHGYTPVEDVHNIYLQFLTETGILGTPFLAGPLLYTWYLSGSQVARLHRQGGTESARMFSVSAFLIQGFLLLLGMLDPTFQKNVFWCFYGLALLFLAASMELGGAALTDPVSRLLQRIIDKCAPLCSKVWGWAAGLLKPLRRK